MHSHSNSLRAGYPVLLTTGPLRQERLTLLPVLCAGGLLAVMLLSPANIGAQTIKTVCPQGPPTCDYSTISNAVSTVPLGPGITIRVKPGTYREQVTIPVARGGSAQSQAIIEAETAGTVTIEGSTPLSWSSCTPFTGVYHAPVTIALPLDDTIVSVDTVLYTYNNTGAPYCTVPAGQYKYDNLAQPPQLYVYSPGGVGANTYVSQRVNGFNINASYVTIDGFIVNHTAGPGIQALGTTANRVQSVIIRNCASAYNKRHGILLQYTSNGSVITSRAYNNARHGVCLRASDNSYLAHNEAFRNDNPLVCRGGIAGFKIGDGDTNTIGAASDVVTDATVDYNSAHNNEDTGFDVKGAKRVVLRRNVSYRNQDHGFDNNLANRVVHHNNVASRNDHDGMSIEHSALNVELYNSILTGNGVYPFTLGGPGGVRELFVDEPAGFAAAHNVVVGLAPGSWSGSTVCAPILSGTFYRAAVEWRGESAYATLDDFCAVHATLCAVSSSAYPVWFDSSAATPDFRIAGASSSALDAAETSRADWLPLDSRGFGAWNGPATNRGLGQVTYADIGAYEDVRPGTITDLSAPAPAGTHSVVLVWTATSDDLAAGGKAEYTDIRYAPSPMFSEAAFELATQVSGEPQPSDSGVEQNYEVSGLNSCTEYHFAIKYGDKTGNYSAVSNTVPKTTSCGGGGGCQPAPCEIDRPGGNRAVAGREAEDFPLGLKGVVPNPSRGLSMVEWSIPQRLAGAQYDLSLYDVAGRKVAAVASGTAKAGRFVQRLSFGRADGKVLSTGVFFLRLKIGEEVSKRAVVLTH